MKKKLMTVLALVLVIAMSVAGTYAYLTSQASVKNTFTVGKVAITLDEAKTNVDGKKVDANGNILAEGGTDYRIPNDADETNGNSYKLMPGHEYSKDPTVHVVAGSEACYVFVKVEDGLTNIETATEADPSIAMQIASNGWNHLESVDNVYYKSVDAATAATGTSLVVFNGFKLTDDANTTGYETANITITAYAVQQDGFGTALGAWNATFGK